MSGAYIVLARAVSVGLAIITLPLLARGLGPAGRGESASAISLILIVPLVLSLGLPIAIRRAASREPATLRAWRDVCMKVGVVAAALAVGVAVIAIRTIFRTLEAEARVAILYGLPVAACCGVVWLCMANVSIGRGHIARYCAVVVCPSASMFILVVLLAVSGKLTVASTVYAQMCAYVCTAALALVVNPVSPGGAGPGFRVAVSTTMRYWGSQVAEALSFRLDQTIAVSVIGAGAAGLYSVATTVGFLPYVIGQALASAAFSRISGSGDRRSLRRSVIIQVAVVSTLVSAVLAVTVPFVIPAAFGSDFRSAINPTLVLLVGSLALSVAQAFSAFLIADGRGWVLTASQVAGLTVGIAGLLALGPLYGISGAVAASVAGAWTTLGCLVAATRRETQVAQIAEH